MIKVIQIGFGPLGVQTAKFIAKKSTIKTVAVVDNDPDLYNKNINDFSSDLDNKICISNSVNEALKNINKKPDVAIITTVSSLKEIYNQINEVVKHNINIISTCEEFDIDSTMVALSGGEDYELLFTVSIADFEKIKGNPHLSIIGHINDKAAGLNLVTRAGQELELKAQGWNALENK